VAGAGTEAELQLTSVVVAERRGTVFLLLGMVAWVLAAVVGTLAVWGVLTLAPYVLRRIVVVPEPSRLVYTLLGGYGFHGTLLLGALWQGRRLGMGSWRAGLSVGPVRRKAWIALFCVMMIGWLIGVIALTAAIPALRDYMKSMTPEFLISDLGDASPGIVGLLLGLVVIVAPMAEELFFRGWLWEASRRRGNAVVTTAVLTAIPWLLLHGIESPGRILVLLPAAVIFSFARQMGGGVLASLTVHVTNNMSVALVQVAAALVGHE
jgi:membrane protease YdiL (CAAX protease family)